ITEIPYSVFSNCQSLKEIVIPDGVTLIDGSAFRDCRSLTEITIPDSVTEIGSQAFYNCRSLEEIVIPDGVEEIQYSTFNGCTNLKKVILPDFLTNIGNNAFSDCTSLESFAFPIDMTERPFLSIFSGCTALKEIAFSYELDLLTWHDNYKTYFPNLERIIMFSRNCNIIASNLPTNITIYGFANSTAESFAKKQGNPFVVLDEEKLDAPVPNFVINKDNTTTISWNSIEGAGTYEVYALDNDKKEYYLKATTADTSITIDATDLPEYASGTTYRVRAVSAKNRKFVSDYGYAYVTNDTILKTPTPVVKVNSDATFTLSWEAVNGANYYEIYLVNTDGSNSLLKTVNTNSETISGVDYGKTYSYKVRACHKGMIPAFSDYSKAVSATNNSKLPTPKAKVAVNANGSFTISWNAVSGADKYEVYYDNGAGYKLLRTVTGTSATTAVAAQGKNYSYKVKAVTNKNSSATSDFSNVVTAINNLKLQTPTAKVKVNANGSFTISWNAVSNADKYEVYYNSGTGYKLLRTTTGISTTTAVAAKGKTYSYKVRAVTSKNSSATSNYSNVVSATRK
ncbi:MAG: leucine-rich repeat domain-containing protein, partial [Eubacterium sp.]|nr:leucine-rich repeat domain-containing protein [Eubacterium sp.]